jgi:hypothetical protein
MRIREHARLSWEMADALRRLLRSAPNAFLACPPPSLLQKRRRLRASELRTLSWTIGPGNLPKYSCVTKLSIGDHRVRPSCSRRLVATIRFVEDRIRPAPSGLRARVIPDDLVFWNHPRSYAETSLALFEYATSLLRSRTSAIFARRPRCSF